MLFNQQFTQPISNPVLLDSKQFFEKKGYEKDFGESWHQFVVKSSEEEIPPLA